MYSLLAACVIIGILVTLYIRQHYRPSSAKVRIQRDLEHHQNSELRKRILEKHEQMGDLSSDLRKEINSQITVADIMTCKIASASENTAVAELNECMSHHGTRHLVIQNESGRLVGVVSQRDVLAGGRTAADIMTHHPITVSPSSSIGNAVALILNNRISCLPVIEDDRLSGILTTSDLLMALERLVEFYEGHMTGGPDQPRFKNSRHDSSEQLAQTAS